MLKCSKLSMFKIKSKQSRYRVRQLYLYKCKCSSRYKIKPLLLRYLLNSTKMDTQKFYEITAITE